MGTNQVSHLDVRELSFGSAIRREGRLKVDGEADALEWHYDIYGGEAEELPSFDGFVLTALFLAMRRGLPLRVHGELTETALGNFEEFVTAWSQWRPKLYKRFDIIPDKIISSNRKPLRRAISAFSGGVDATFTIVHNKMRLGTGGHDIRSVMMVHGFDVDYGNDAGFAKLVARVQPTLDRLGVGLKIIKTDSKKYCEGEDWDDWFGAQIAGCMHQFSGAYDTGLIGSSEPYAALLIPVGASPLTDRLFSGSFMSLVHHGAQFSRTMKVEVLAQFPEIVERLKVCWEGPLQHENCGICEKCIRTRLNFMAVGQAKPGCFVDAFDPSFVRKIKGRKSFQLNELATLISYAEERHVSDPWVGMLRRRLKWLRLRGASIAILERTSLKRHLCNVRRLWRAIQWQLSSAFRRKDLHIPTEKGAYDDDVLRRG